MGMEHVIPMASVFVMRLITEALLATNAPQITTHIPLAPVC